MENEPNQQTEITLVQIFRTELFMECLFNSAVATHDP
jgi:hypothetical protein